MKKLANCKSGKDFYRTTADGYYNPIYQLIYNNIIRLMLHHDEINSLSNSGPDSYKSFWFVYDMRFPIQNEVNS
jgi:hypothetical protein